MPQPWQEPPPKLVSDGVLERIGLWMIELGILMALFICAILAG